MKSFGWIFAGGIAAAVGAAVWAAIGYYAELELGWIAWIIGGIVGAAVAATAKDRAGVATGVGAACIALAGILGGKYAAIRLMVEDAAQQAGVGEVTEELVISFVADTVVEERIEAGQEIDWPTEYGLGEATAEEEYPEDIWAEAVARWEVAGPEWQAQHREYVEHTVQANLAAFKGEFSSATLFEELNLIDAVFFFLAVFTAYGIGSGGSGSGESRPG